MAGESTFTDMIIKVIPMSNDAVKPWKDRSVWMRALYMLMFAVIYSVAEIVVVVVVVFQFFYVLFSGRKNHKALGFGQSLCAYIYEILRFETFDSEYLPFPFGDWPWPGAPVKRDNESGHRDGL